MSCQNNANKAASIRCGISRATAQFASAQASVRGKVESTLKRTDAAGYAAASRLSPVANATLGAVNAAERLGAGTLVRWGMGMAFAEVRAVSVFADKGLKLAGSASVPVGSAVGDLSRRELKSSVVQTSRFLGFFKKKTDVRAWSSGLTPALNAGDLLTPGSRRNVTASEGVVIKVDGKSWHNGATTVKTPAGARTINHLQSLTLPSQHYYFNRALPDRELAAVVAGQTNPTSVPGYVGQISSMEALTPGWAGTKRMMIKAQIFGHKTNVAPPRHNLGPLTRLPNPAEVERLVKQGRGQAGKAREFATREVPETEILFQEAEKIFKGGK